MSDYIGERGENIVKVLLTRRYGSAQPLFRPHFLGDKYPTVDFLVELVGVNAPFVPYFFAQVKATALGYTRAGRCLRIRVSTADMRRLVAYPAPTYIVGLDEPAEQGYIVAALSGAVSQMPSLSTAHPLNEETLQELYAEVYHFWQTNGVAFTTSILV